MQLINLTFHLGVIFAIFSFIWGIIHLILNAIRGGKPTSIVEEYFLKTVQYFLLVNVVFLSCINDTANILLNQLILSSLILLLYFVSKFQKRQQNSDMLAAMNRRFNNDTSGANQLPFNFPGFKSNFNPTAEIIVISASIVLFVGFFWFPDVAQNWLAAFFYQRIQLFEELPIIGFIFKVIGFFFLVSILFKIINGILLLLTGNPLFLVQRRFGKNNHPDEQDTHNKSDDDFDDYEEIK